MATPDANHRSTSPGTTKPWRTRATSAEILQRRAVELARAAELTHGVRRMAEFLGLRLGAETFALDANAVVGVLALQESVPLPGVPAHIHGLINVRSRIVPLVDLRPLWRLPREGRIGPRQVVLVEVEHIEFGLLADEILDVGQLNLAELRPLPATAALNTRHLRGLIGSILLLDLPALLPDLIVNQSRSASSTQPRS